MWHPRLHGLLPIHREARGPWNDVGRIWGSGQPIGNDHELPGGNEPVLVLLENHWRWGTGVIRTLPAENRQVSLVQVGNHFPRRTGRAKDAGSEGTGSKHGGCFLKCRWLLSVSVQELTSPETQTHVPEGPFQITRKNPIRFSEKGDSSING